MNFKFCYKLATMDVKNMISYIDTMVADKELKKEEKINLLNEWEGKLQEIPQGRILHSSELKDVTTVIKHVKICSERVACL
jgi:hypothetical protein